MSLTKCFNFCSQVDPDWFLQGEGHPLPPVVPEQLLTSSGTNIVMPQASTLSQRQERLERYKDSFDLDIFEQVASSFVYWICLCAKLKFATFFVFNVSHKRI
jgi:hypothetical protein